MQPIILWNAPAGNGPNPWKVAVVLEELELPYTMSWVKYLDARKEPFLSINPNGKVPALEDLNTGVQVFESGACIEYIIDTYDLDHRLSYADAKLKYLTKSWVFFQCSAQGPYFGQKIWFTHFHPEKNIGSAIGRYGWETKRILGVIERTLSKQAEAGNLWLVGYKCTYADLAFVQYNSMLPWMFPEGLDFEKEFPRTYAWHERMMSREAVKKIFEEKAHANATLTDSADEARLAR